VPTIVVLVLTEVEVFVDVAVDVLVFRETPQHINVPSVITPHALSCPQLTEEKVPVGGLVCQ
jgi:hypothetical protein